MRQNALISAKTIYWNPDLKVDRSGKATIEFYCSDEITSFRTTVEGIGAGGEIGRSEEVFYTQLPFSMKARVPVEVATNDKLVVPVVLTNNTKQSMSGSLHVMPPSGLEPLTTTGSLISIPAGQVKTVHLAYKVKHEPAEEPFSIAFASQGHTDEFQQKLKIVPQGFPVQMSFSGREKSRSLQVQGCIADGAWINDCVFYSLPKRDVRPA